MSNGESRRMAEPGPTPDPVPPPVPQRAATPPSPSQPPRRNNGGRTLLNDEPPPTPRPRPTPPNPRPEEEVEEFNDHYRDKASAKHKVRNKSLLDIICSEEIVARRIQPVVTAVMRSEQISNVFEDWIKLYSLTQEQCAKAAMEFARYLADNGASEQIDLKHPVTTLGTVDGQGIEFSHLAPPFHDHKATFRQFLCAYAQIVFSQAVRTETPFANAGRRGHKPETAYVAFDGAEYIESTAAIQCAMPRRLTDKEREAIAASKAVALLNTPTDQNLNVSARVTKGVGPPPPRTDFA